MEELVELELIDDCRYLLLRFESKTFRRAVVDISTIVSRMVATEDMVNVSICFHREDSKRHPHGPSYLPINRMTLDLMIVHKTKFFPSTRIHPSLLVSEKDHEKDHEKDQKRTAMFLSCLGKRTGKRTAKRTGKRTAWTGLMSIISISAACKLQLFYVRSGIKYKLNLLQVSLHLLLVSILSSRPLLEGSKTRAYWNWVSRKWQQAIDYLHQSSYRKGDSGCHCSSENKTQNLMYIIVERIVWWTIVFVSVSPVVVCCGTQCVMSD